jgi:hypothetical protein
MDEPIATYHDHIAGLVDRVITLYEDRVVFAGRYFLGARFESTFHFVELQPVRQKLWNRTRHFVLAVIATFAFAPFALIGVVAKVAFNSPWLPVVLATAPFVVSCAYLACTWTPIEFAQFFANDRRFTIDVARSGPDAVMFDEFVSRLELQIQRCQSPS